jgi:hypothetical protein
MQASRGPNGHFVDTLVFFAGCSFPIELYATKAAVQSSSQSSSMVFMLSDSNTHGRDPITIWSQAILAVVALFALSVARSVPPEFTAALSHRPAIDSISAHDHRPHFDADGPQWIAPASSSLPFPPVAVSAHLSRSSQLLSTLEVKGFRFNRPPPVS